MSENTRKFYISEGENFEKEHEYEKALECYLSAFSIKECAENDDFELFKPSLIEDKIAFLAYRLGDYRKALTYGAMAYRLNPNDTRLRNNLPFYTDGILYANPKEHLDKFIEKEIKSISSESTVLDIGPYDGRWSMRLRDTFSHIDAVEAFEPYVEQYNLMDKYTNVFISDIMDFDFNYYDIIIMGDVLEHLDIDKAQKIVKRLCEKCNKLFIIIPFEYPQDEYDNNEYQIHKQEDLTKEIMKERYPELECLAYDEVRGVYVKKGTYSSLDINLIPKLNHPKTTEVGLQYYANGSYAIAAGVFEDSLEKMTDLECAYADYYLGLCHNKLGHKFEALKAFLNAVTLVPSYKNAYYEAFKILENSGLWSDFEYYLRMALEHKNEICPLDVNTVEYWENLLMIQMTFVLSNLKKKFEAYGYASLALETEMSEERRKIAQNNYNEMKKELWGTLQI